MSQTQSNNRFIPLLVGLCLALTLSCLTGCTGGSSRSTRMTDEEKQEFATNLMTEGTPEHDWYENTYKKEHGID